MCVVCGCAETGAAAGGDVVVAENGDLHYGAGAARVSVPGMSAERAIKLEADVLGANNRIAARTARISARTASRPTTWSPARARARPPCCARPSGACGPGHRRCRWR
jgi:hypothetical protein